MVETLDKLMIDSDMDTKFVQTFGGGIFYLSPERLKENKLSLIQVAHVLGCQPRWSGNTSRFYSVAQHSTHVYRQVRLKYPERLDLQWEALMHDSPESIMLDFPRPLKAMLPDYSKMLIGIEQMFSEWFNFPYIMTPEVREADDRMLVTEYHQLIDVTEPKKNLLDFMDPYDLDLKASNQFWSPALSKIYFMHCAYEILKNSDIYPYDDKDYRPK